MLDDLKYALRTLRKSPGFALVAIISLALGIGANSAIFSLADALLLRPLPVPHASELIVVQSQLRGEAIGGISQYSGLSYPDFKDLRDRNKSYTGVAASQYSQFGFATEKGALPQMKFGELVSGDFFRVLDVPLALGRAFRPDEDSVPGRDAVVVLGHELWRTDFASDPDVVGRTIFLNNVPFTVIGVAPEPFTGSNGLVRSALFVPLAMGAAPAGRPAAKHAAEARQPRHDRVRAAETGRQRGASGGRGQGDLAATRPGLSGDQSNLLHGGRQRGRKPG